MANVKASTILRKALTYLYPDLPGMPIGDLMFGVRAAVSVVVGFSPETAERKYAADAAHQLDGIAKDASVGPGRQALRFDLMVAEAEFLRTQGQ